MDKNEILDKWKNIAIEHIEHIQNGKRKKNQAPVHASEVDVITLVQKRMLHVLSELAEAGEIQQGETVHGKFYKY